MSIVIVVLDPRDQTVNIMADRRATTKDRTTGKVLEVNDKTEKILQLTNTIRLGITGDLKCCLNLHKKLMQMSSTSASDIMKECRYWSANNDCCSFVVAGVNDDNQLFAFYRTMQNSFELILLDDQVRYVILTHKFVLNNVFEQELIETRSTNLAMKRTINYAAKLDDSISVESTFVKISIEQ